MSREPIENEWTARVATVPGDAVTAMTDARESAAREVLARHHKREKGFYAGPDILPKWCVAAMLEFANTDLEAVREACAKVAEAYSEVNFEQAGDSVLLDPVLCGKGFTPENLAESERQQVKGLVHSSQAHAGLHIAAAIRNTDFTKGAEG